MKHPLLLALLLSWPLVGSSQSDGLLKDTVALKEVTVGAVLPLKDKQVVEFYRPGQFSSIDPINARLEGLSLIKRGAYALEPQLNGFSGGQLNVTIDGMKMFGACTDRMDPITSYIEPSNLKSIVITKGTNGSHQGCNIGGSVDMALGEALTTTPHGWQGSLGAGYESISRGRTLLLSLGYAAPKFAWALDGVLRKNESYRDGNNRLVPFSQFQKSNVHGVVQYLPNPVHSFKLDLLADVATDIGYPALPMDVSSAKAALLALEYRRTAPTQWLAKVYVNAIRHVMDDSHRDSLFRLPPGQGRPSDSVYMRMDMPGQSATLGAYLQGSRNWKNRHRLTLKADHYTNYSLAEMTMHMRFARQAPEAPMYLQTWPAMRRHVTGLFLQHSWQLSTPLSLSANARVEALSDRTRSDYARQQFSVFNYRVSEWQHRLLKSANLGLQVHLSSSLSATATAGMGERAPTLGERLGYYLFSAYDGYDYIGNPTLRNEQSRFVNLSLQLTTPALKLSISPSLSRVTDLIMGQTDTLVPTLNFTARGTRRYTNLPSAMFYSLDAQLWWEPVKNLSLLSTSKYTHAALSGGEPLPLIPPLKTFTALQYRRGPFLLQAENETALAQRRVNQAYGEQPSPSFGLFHLKTSCELSLTPARLLLGLSVTNLLNRSYHEHLDWGRIPRPGRSIDALLKLEF